MKSYTAPNAQQLTSPAHQAAVKLTTGLGLCFVLLVLMVMSGCKDAAKTGTGSSATTPPPLSMPQSTPAEPPAAPNGAASASKP